MKKSKRKVLLLITILFMIFSGPFVWGAEGEKVNINKATVVELMTLKNVGEKYAERILTYREENGSFEKPEDIMKVKGIGRKIFDLNKERIAIE